MLAAFAAFCTLDVCLDWNTFGLLTGDHEWAKYIVIGGWSLTAEQLYIGITRLSYPFLIGLIISRLGKTIKLKGCFMWADSCSAQTEQCLQCVFLGLVSAVRNTGNAIFFVFCQQWVRMAISIAWITVNCLHYQQ
jgi:hypothetical protein